MIIASGQTALYRLIGICVGVAIGVGLLWSFLNSSGSNSKENVKRLSGMWEVVHNWNSTQHIYLLKADSTYVITPIKDGRESSGKWRAGAKGIYFSEDKPEKYERFELFIKADEKDGVVSSFSLEQSGGRTLDFKRMSK